MRPPIKMQSSLSEIEYCSFLRYSLEKDSFQDAWSPLGQKYFKETIPDSYSPTLKKAFFLMGVLSMGIGRNNVNFNDLKHPPKTFLEFHLIKRVKILKQKSKSLKKIMVKRSTQ